MENLSGLAGAMDDTQRKQKLKELLDQIDIKKLLESGGSDLKELVGKILQRNQVIQEVEKKLELGDKLRNRSKLKEIVRKIGDSSKSIVEQVGKMDPEKLANNQDQIREFLRKIDSESQFIEQVQNLDLDGEVLAAKASEPFEDFFRTGQLAELINSGSGGGNCLLSKNDRCGLDFKKAYCTQGCCSGYGHCLNSQGAGDGHCEGRNKDFGFRGFVYCNLSLN